ncbi:MAG: hypothetical protein JKY89_06890 [Immundisolibacteraceae bacterium]|nr:hypothetical protein [Immundisolibacteraceae bacterium]
MALKVTGAGFGRTGTASSKVALEFLGFGPCYHMEEVQKKSERAATWINAWNGEQQDWDKVFAGYQAAVDFPACSFYKQLLNHYPDAKVILTVRDPDRWYQSMADTIWKLSEMFPSWVGLVLPKWKLQMKMAYCVIWDGVFSGQFPDRDHAIEVYRKNIDEVQQAVPSDQLLVFEVRDGWQPLCAFLGVPVPANEPFPKLNEAARFENAKRILHLLSVLPYLASLGLIALLALLFT